MPETLELPMISVVIPSYNNEPILMKCLGALSRQDFPMEWMEVVVIVDGSRDDTMESLRRFAEQAPFRFVFERQENQGPGPARNNGIRRAVSDLILILNDDLIAEPQLVRRHAEWHARHPGKEEALLGYVEEARGPSGGFNMDRLGKAFHRARELKELDWRHFWTTNISLKRRLLAESGEWFSSAFPFPVHEDMEIGYRLGRHGLRLSMDPQARGLHDHVMSYAQFARRAYQSGICLTVFYQLHPELREFLVERGLIAASYPSLNPLRSLAAFTLLNPATVGWVEKAAMVLRRKGDRAVSEFLFTRLLGYHQRRGVRDGLRHQAGASA